jgi:transcriptional regulator with XRE-family HTH domain
MTFNEKLVKLRKLRGITQDEFASAVGVSRQAVYKWESGQSYPEVAKLIEIKALFNVSIDDLLDENYEVVLPEKKKKRISTAKKRAIEEMVAKEEGLVPDETVLAETEKEAEPIVAAKEEAAVESAEKTDVTVNEATEDISQAEKRGFFARLFGR